MVPQRVDDAGVKRKDVMGADADAQLATLAAIGSDGERQTVWREAGRLLVLRPRFQTVTST
jgi:hypothetical protein